MAQIDPNVIREYMKVVGQKGGKAKTPAKAKSSANNLKLAREKRWPTGKAQKAA